MSLWKQPLAQPWDEGAAVSPCSPHGIEECYLEQTCLPNRLAVICQIQFCHDSLNSFTCLCSLAGMSSMFAGCVTHTSVFAGCVTRCAGCVTHEQHVCWLTQSSLQSTCQQWMKRCLRVSSEGTSVGFLVCFKNTWFVYKTVYEVSSCLLFFSNLYM